MAEEAQRLCSRLIITICRESSKMAHQKTTNDLFFNRTSLDPIKTQTRIDDVLKGADDGELYLEYRESEAVVLENGKVKTASFDTSQGFGLRTVKDETSAYAHSAILDDQSIAKACQTVQSITSIDTGVAQPSPIGTNQQLYTDKNPLNVTNLEEKIKFLSQIDQYLRQQEADIKQIVCSLTGQWQAIQILRLGSKSYSDIRPLIRLNISVVLEKNGRQEEGHFGTGGRSLFTEFMNENNWKAYADEALRQARVNLDSKPTPAGEMTVVLGNGWPGILLHEAIGHGLEGDHIRKNTSAFSGLLGEQIASDQITVLDDGTIHDRRGSLTIDDEGTPSQSTTLIENGKLVGFMHDRLSARQMNIKETGNGRRESYAHLPMPRMTNTYMINGQYDPKEIISSVKKGIYAVSFGGGQVDTTSGKFVFSCSEAYELNDGKIGAPLKGATLIGNGPEILKQVSMVGNDMKLDPGVGTCGKQGQSVPVGVGQPSLKIDKITVGGTET